MFRQDVLKGVRNAAQFAIGICILALLWPATANAESVTLVWEPSPDTNVVGYNVYYGTASRAYTQMVNAGNSTSATISNLTEGVTYYFAATAYDSWGLESDFSEEASYTVPFKILNYPPTLDPLSNITLLENAGAQSVQLGGISSGSTNEPQDLVVSAISSNPSLIPSPAVSYISPSTTGSLSFTPAANGSGTAIITVRVSDGGVTNAVCTRAFTVTVVDVNQTPTLAAIGNVVVNEDAGEQTISLSGISSGAANESQTLTVTASSSNPGLIAAPQVTYASPGATGSLRFAPVANASGTAEITVTVNDGGSSNNVVARKFSVAVNPVNDAPTIASVGTIVINRGTASQVVQLSGITSGATNETDVLSVSAQSSNPAVIPDPTLAYTSPSRTGTLTIAPQSTNGASTITVTVNDGQSQNNSASISFNVVVNDLPTISDIPNKGVALGSNVPPVSFTIGDTETPADALLVFASSSDTLLVPEGSISFGGAGANRTLSITPGAGLTGIATITVFVTDGTATNSDTFQFAVQQRPAPPAVIQLVVEGQGQISPALTSAMVPGKTYTLTAVPAADQEFAGWSGSVVSCASKITFVAEAGAVIKAKFVPSPFIPSKGTYTGLFYETNEVRQNSSGFFSVQSTARGKYTGFVQIGTKRHQFAGKFALDGQATNTIKRAGQLPLRLMIALGTGGSTDTLLGTLTDGTWSAILNGNRSAYNASTNPAPAGVYTLVVPGQQADPTLPYGHSYGTLKISPSGTASLLMKLADGVTTTRTTKLSGPTFPLYVPLYAGAGSLISWGTLENRETDDVHGDLQWIRPANRTHKLFPAGFSYKTELLGSVYDKAATFTGAEFGATVTFTRVDGEFSNEVTFSGTGNVANLGPGKMFMRMTPGSGLFRGSVTDPETGAVSEFGGCLFQKQGGGFGFHKDSLTCGAVALH